jgi:hypothetical protein
MEAYANIDDDQAGCLNWSATESGGLYYDDGVVHAIIFERRGGWAYTVRYQWDEETWLQVSSGRNDYWAAPEHVIKPALKGLARLYKILRECVW